MTNTRTCCLPIKIETGSEDQDGCLVTIDGCLVAVLVRIEQHDDLDPALWDQWYVEAAFGPCSKAPGELITFATCEAAAEWAIQRCERRSRSAA
jgi:hypothetical protein